MSARRGVGETDTVSTRLTRHQLWPDGSFFTRKSKNPHGVDETDTVSLRLTRRQLWPHGDFFTTKSKNPHGVDETAAVSTRPPLTYGACYAIDTCYVGRGHTEVFATCITDHVGTLCYVYSGICST